MSAPIEDIEARPSVLVELLTAAGCSQCLKAQHLIESIAREFDPDQVGYREVKVLDDIDYAVSLGVLNTPAVAINGALAFNGPPSAKNLRRAIEARLDSPASS